MTERSARQFAEELVNRRGDINRELSRNGVRFGVYKNGEYHDRLFPYDPIPRIIESDEFDELEAGLKQRVNALNAYLKDIYSDKRIIHDGRHPRRIRVQSAGYFPQVNGVTPPGGIFAHIAGEDLVQGEDGRWWVLEDNLRIPSGASLPAVRARHRTPYESQTVPRRARARQPRLSAAAAQGHGLVSTEGIAVVLTPGRYNSASSSTPTWPRRPARRSRSPKTWKLSTTSCTSSTMPATGIAWAPCTAACPTNTSTRSRSTRTRLSACPDCCRPTVPATSPSSRARQRGRGRQGDLLFSCRRWSVTTSTRSRSCTTRRPTCRCSRRTARKCSTAWGELVIKDVAEAGGYGVVFGSSLDKAAREDLADRIKEDPRRFIAQEVIQFRDIDVIDPDSGEVSPRKCDLRAFVVTGQNTHVWYSGLTRYSSVPGPDDRQLVAGAADSRIRGCWRPKTAARTSSARSRSPR